MACTQTVELGDRAYPIRIGTGLLDQLGTACAQQGLQGTGLLVTDDVVHALYGEAAFYALSEAGFRVAEHVVPAGESSKCHKELIAIYEAALEAGLERASFIIALGGGVVGDLAGYAAATYLRGLKLVQVPTTLLAMVDSAVGGKTGINLPQGKNLVGAFHQPALVLSDLGVLRSLPSREFAAGMAEVIKYGIIADPALLDILETAGPDEVLSDTARLEEIVRRSCDIKADVVRRDEREGGVRAILNFGHTLGHAIEQVTGYNEYLHGEAVAIGMVYASRLSERVTGLSPAATDKVMRVLRRQLLPMALPDLPWSALLRAMQRDKKRTRGAVGFVLARELGCVEYGCAVPESVLEEAWYGDVE